MSIEGDQLTTSINCHSNPQLWNLHENPNGEFMTLRNVAPPCRALDVWHGYSVIHSNQQTAGTVLEVVDVTDAGLFSFKGRYSGQLLSINNDGKVASVDHSCPESSFIMI